ncbi:MAG: hypothetical protein IPK75_17975 [Acidobacteria bacterium]|nr:hypothetical protein [Acidobacteriota bacterium]
MSEELRMAAADGSTIAQQAARIAELEVQLDIARKFEAHYQTRNHEAWVLVGELDYGLEYQIGQAKTLPAAKKVARALRQRIAQAIGKKAE